MAVFLNASILITSTPLTSLFSIIHLAFFADDASGLSPIILKFSLSAKLCFLASLNHSSCRLACPQTIKVFLNFLSSTIIITVLDFPVPCGKLIKILSTSLANATASSWYPYLFLLTLANVGNSSLSSIIISELLATFS